MQTPHVDSTVTLFDARWRAALAPRTGDIRRELAMEAAEYLGVTIEEVERRIEGSATDFPEEWNRMVTDPGDPQQLIRFYNESEAELFEQIAWHSSEPIHHRSLVCSDLASTLPGREFLDYGSGIGSNALVFGLAGFRVTLADIADPLRNFARWRCERRGIPVRTIDLKSETLETARYDVITCFDVLEHVPDPLAAVRRMRDALRIGGVFFLYAPFGFDPVRPMHVVHDDPVSRRVRALGFSINSDWEQAFPPHVYPPHPYTRVARSGPANLAYYIRDAWFSGKIGDALARTMRLTGRRKTFNRPAVPTAGAGACPPL
jgi:2-polyprenyl-3-methyl-5-hydroxy-6-metoxy-1,4-benzoquinol methylase